MQEEPLGGTPDSTGVIELNLGKCSGNMVPGRAPLAFAVFYFLGHAEVPFSVAVNAESVRFGVQQRPNSRRLVTVDYNRWEPAISGPLTFLNRSRICRATNWIPNMIQAFLDQVIEHAYALLPEEADARNLPEPMRTVVIVHAAQGIIDNGGLEYFFESDFPLKPPYSMFVDAFRVIGADAVAKCIEVSAAMFPFPHPHLHEAQRQGWLASIQDIDEHEFARLSRRACGDEAVWKKLTEFVGRNRDALGAAVSGEN